MKNYFFAAVMVVVFLAGTASPLLAQAQIPANVKSAVTQLFPEGEQVEWANDDDERMVYLLDEGGNNVEIMFGKDGAWIQIDTYMGFDDLPTAAQTYLEGNHNGMDFNNVLKNKTQRQTMYIVNFESARELFTLSFDEDGKLIEQQVEAIDGE